MDNLAVTNAWGHAGAAGFEAHAQSSAQELAAEGLEAF
jgi:hypothetical protein